MCMYVCVYVYVYVCLCEFVCVYVHEYALYSRLFSLGANSPEFPKQTYTSGKYILAAA